MTISFKRYTELTEQVEELKKEADKAEGALEQIKTRLKEEHGCSSVKEAKKLLRKKQKEMETLEAKFTESLEAFEQEHAPAFDALQKDDESPAKRKAKRH